MGEVRDMEKRRKLELYITGRVKEKADYGILTQAVVRFEEGKI